MRAWLRFFVCGLVFFAQAACQNQSEGRRAASNSKPGSSSESVREKGHCEHSLPSAICPQCNPALAAVFQAKGDWCAEHGFPESFCPQCKPNAPLPDVGVETAVVTDWCGGHGLPESKCTKCNPGLVSQFKAQGDWCEEHGFPESACPVCQPQKAPGVAGQPVSDWCIEHGLPESKCSQCNPSLIKQFRSAGDWCQEHGFPESVCPKCNPQNPPVGVEQIAIEARVVRLRAPELEHSAGIQSVPARRAQRSEIVSCTARIAFDSDRVADIRAIVPGIVRKIRKKLGAKVERGMPLFDLESTRVGEIQGTLQKAREQVRTAQANLARQQQLRESDIASARQVEVAEQELANAQVEARTAEATLRMAGASQSTPSGRYTLVAPIAGALVRRPAVIGLLATESESLATIADTSLMWALCDVPQADASRISLGQTVVVSVDGRRDASFTGELTWIAAEVNPRTRTVTARAEVPNPAGHLRAHQFARATIQTGAPRTATTVPRSAIQRVGKLEVVFVRMERGVYEPRVVVRRAYNDDDWVQVEGRVQEGDAVVTTGAVLLRTEIMPGSIGAGCCEVEPLRLEIEHELEHEQDLGSD